MNEEETNEVELLKKWIGLKDTGLCYITFKIEEVEIFLNLISKLQIKIEELQAINEKVKELEEMELDNNDIFDKSRVNFKRNKKE